MPATVSTLFFSDVDRLSRLSSSEICREAKSLARSHYHRTKNLGETELRIYANRVHEYGIKLVPYSDAVIQGTILRLRSEKYWRKTLNRLADSQREHLSRLHHRESGSIGEIRYCSDATVKVFEERKQRISAQMIANDREHLLNIYTTGSSSRHKRLYLILKGLERLAEIRSFGWVMLTLTCPPEYHPCSKSYNNFSFKDGQRYLARNWSKLTKDLSKEFVAGEDYFGVRVVEAHKSGTPHWHVLLFSKNDVVARLQKKLALVYKKEASRPASYLTDNLEKIFFQGDSERLFHSKSCASYIYKKLSAGLVKDANADDDSATRHTYALKASRARMFQTIGFSGLSGKLSALAKVTRSSNAPASIADIAKDLVLPKGEDRRLERQLEAMVSLLNDGHKNLRVVREAATNRYGEAIRKPAYLVNQSTGETFTLGTEKAIGSDVVRRSVKPPTKRGGVKVNDLIIEIHGKSKGTSTHKQPQEIEKIITAQNALVPPDSIAARSRPPSISTFFHHLRVICLVLLLRVLPQGALPEYRQSTRKYSYQTQSTCRMRHRFLPRQYTWHHRRNSMPPSRPKYYLTRFFGTSEGVHQLQLPLGFLSLPDKMLKISQTPVSSTKDPPESAFLTDLVL